MVIKNSTQENLDDIMKLIHQAQNYFKNANIDQWQDGYPNNETIRDDILQNNSYILIENNQVIATMYLSFENEPTYSHIDGQWLTDYPYAVIHRIVVDENQKGKNIAGKLLKFATQKCKEKNIYSIRIDTHNDNHSMQKFLYKNGFQLCGNITLESGAPRIAFEKILA